jgi:hypothetical protein
MIAITPNIPSEDFKILKDIYSEQKSHLAQFYLLPSPLAVQTAFEEKHPLKKGIYSNEVFSRIVDNWNKYPQFFKARASRDSLPVLTCSHSNQQNIPYDQEEQVSQVYTNAQEQSLKAIYYNEYAKEIGAKNGHEIAEVSSHISEEDSRMLPTSTNAPAEIPQVGSTQKKTRFVKGKEISDEHKALLKQTYEKVIKNPHKLRIPAVFKEFKGEIEQKGGSFSYSYNQVSNEVTKLWPERLEQRAQGISKALNFSPEDREILKDIYIAQKSKLAPDKFPFPIDVQNAFKEKKYSYKQVYSVVHNWNKNPHLLVETSSQDHSSSQTLTISNDTPTAISEEGGPIQKKAKTFKGQKITTEPMEERLERIYTIAEKKDLSPAVRKLKNAIKEQGGIVKRTSAKATKINQKQSKVLDVFSSEDLKILKAIYIEEKEKRLALLLASLNIKQLFDEELPLNTYTYDQIHRAICFWNENPQYFEVESSQVEQETIGSREEPHRITPMTEEDDNALEVANMLLGIRKQAFQGNLNNE